MFGRRVLLPLIVATAILGTQYVLVTNGTATGVFSRSDTGRLTPWPTLVPFSVNDHVPRVFWPALRLFVSPATLLCQAVFRYAALHPEGLVMRYLSAAHESPTQEHRFLLQLALFNSAFWFGAWLLGRAAFGRLKGTPPNT